LLLVFFIYPLILLSPSLHYTRCVCQLFIKKLDDDDYDEHVVGWWIATTVKLPTVQGRHWLREPTSSIFPEKN